MSNPSKAKSTTSAAHRKLAIKSKAKTASSKTSKNGGSKPLKSPNEISQKIARRQETLIKDKENFENYLNTIPKELSIFPNHFSQKRKPGESLSTVIADAMELVALMEVFMHSTQDSNDSFDSIETAYRRLRKEIQEEIQKFEAILTPKAMSILEKSHQNIFRDSNPSDFIKALDSYKTNIDVILSRKIDYFQVPKIILGQPKTSATATFSGADIFMNAVQDFKKKMQALISGTTQFMLEHRITPPDSRRESRPSSASSETRTNLRQESSFEEIAHYDAEKSARDWWQAFTHSNPHVSWEEKRNALDEMLKATNELSTQYFAKLRKYKKEIEGLSEKLAVNKNNAIKFIEHERNQLTIQEVVELNTEKFAQHEWDKYLHENPHHGARDKISKLEEILQTTQQLTQDRLSYIDQNRAHFKPEDAFELTMTLSLRQKDVAKFVEEQRNKLSGPSIR